MQAKVGSGHRVCRHHRKPGRQTSGEPCRVLSAQCIPRLLGAAFRWANWRTIRPRVAAGQIRRPPTLGWPHGNSCRQGPAPKRSGPTGDNPPSRPGWWNGTVPWRCEWLSAAPTRGEWATAAAVDAAAFAATACSEAASLAELTRASFWQEASSSAEKRNVPKKGFFSWFVVYVRK